MKKRAHTTPRLHLILLRSERGLFASGLVPVSAEDNEADSGSEVEVGRVDDMCKFFS